MFFLERSFEGLSVDDWEGERQLKGWKRAREIRRSNFSISKTVNPFVFVFER